MLPPSSIQNSAGNASTPRSTQELFSALTVDKATQVIIKQVSPNTQQTGPTNQPATTTLVIQLGNQQYQIKTQQQPGQTLSAQAQAIVTRTAEGKLLLDLLQQPSSRATSGTQAEQTGKTPSAAQPTSTAGTAASQPQTAATPRNAPLQINLGQPQPAPLTINRPISGQSIQVIPPTVTGNGSSATATTGTSTPANAAPPAATQIQNTAISAGQPNAATRQPALLQTPTGAASAAPSQLPAVTQPGTAQASTQASSPNNSVTSANQPATVNQSPPAIPASQSTAATNQPGRPQHANPAQSAQPVQILAQPGAALSKQLPLQRPVVINVEQTTLQASGSQTLQVKIGTQNLSLQSPAPIQVTDKAVLLRTSDTQAVLQPISPDIQSRDTQKVISDTLREVLPNQQSLANVLNQLNDIGKQNNKPENSSLNRLLSSLMNLYSVPAEGGKEASQSIQRNVQDGGLFSERQLLNNKPQPQDLKAQLGQLLNAADSLPEQPRQQMLDLIKSLLNRVTQNQLESLQQNRTNPDGSLERVFTLDLPVRQGQQLDNVELKISEYRREDSEQEWQSSWKVRLHFDLEQQGTVDAEVLLEQNNEVTAQFWCSSPSTTNLLNDKLSGFNQHLQDQGFVINNLNCHTGKTPTAKNQVQQLIDIST